MRRTFLAALCAIMLVGCNNKEKFTVEGSVEGAQDSVLYLEQVALTGLNRLDSVVLDANGNFHFEADATKEPEFYVLRIHDQIINLSVDSTETITIKAQWPNMAARYEVEGSYNCQKIKELALKQQNLQRQAIALDGNRQLSREEASDSLTKLIKAYKADVSENYIFKEPNQAYAYFALFQTLGQWLLFNPKADQADTRVFAAVATSWDTFYPNSQRTENLHNITIEGMKTQRLVEARSAMSGETEIVESGIIELELTDNHERVQRLSDLKGKVVLLDFHVFAMKESAQRILMLRDIYNKYHDKGLEIYQVAIDQDQHFWKQMTQQLPWISVRDASGESVQRYNVQEIPEYFLIDRNSQLQKRSSQMKSLEKEIEALL